GGAAPRPRRGRGDPGRHVPVPRGRARRRPAPGARRLRGGPVVTWPVLVGWLAGWALLWRLPRLTAARPVDDLGEVVAVIPARNEADRLPKLLASLARQTRPPDRVVVVDDGSDDGTAE